jgi:nucleotide-binding universal stress UspA family protein
VAIDVPLALIQHAAERDALAIVLATRAPTALSRVFLGSVADRVVRESVRPVIVVPPGAAHLGDNHMTIKRVLVPLDGSSLALRSLEYLIQLPQAVTLEYILVEVVPSADLRGAAEDRLRTTATWLRSRGPQSVEEVVLESNDPGRAIVDAVREVLPEIIAMSSRGNGGLGRLMLGSVAEAVVHGSELPVLVLTPKALA